MEFRRYREGDLDKILKLFDVVFSGYSSEYWKWKYENNPAADGRNLIYLAQDKGEIVGYYTCMPVKLRWGNRSILGGQSVDTATHPNYRRKGIFVKLATNLLEV